MKVESTKSTDEWLGLSKYVRPSLSDAGHQILGATKKSYTYNAERVLGSGSFGVVYQAVVVETGESAES
ncbi:ASK3 [Symbiodinium pilosum]|uniref:ASK3 protein n=1 Tax=Symbiodinium pilosum TaxID=2952 RepID=A0A812WWB5_SYMPI|nr:ASK3 [Symbiodinium pilosum]